VVLLILDRALLAQKSPIPRVIVLGCLWFKGKSFPQKEIHTLSFGEGKIGPVVLEPIVQERIWGVTELPEWYAKPEAGKMIGEVWLTAETCVAEAGPLKGMPLAEMAKSYPKLFGGAEFPLLIKVLLPREKLSVQVHPNDTEAQVMGQPHGKSECWYVLSAEPGAAVAVGFKEDISSDQIREAIVGGTLEGKLQYLPVKAGDMVYVDAGTVHAIGPGMVMLETQQYSDVTYRLYDYGRPRELHVDAGLAVSKMKTKAGLVTPVTMDGFVRLVESPYFVVDKFVVRGEVALGLSDRMQMLVAMSDGCSVGAMMLEPGRVVVLPSEGVAYAVSGSGEVIRVAQP
jgi:mannose-6-phosphate isomerase